MISTMLDRLFQRSNVPSGAQVKQRLKFILAHDRAAIEPKVFENMRHEIMRVVSKYVELDEGSLDIRLESDKRMTALIANLPIRMVREEMPDLDELFEVSHDEQNTESSDAEPSSPSALEMDQFAEAALDAIELHEIAKSAPQIPISANITENVDSIAERTDEVTTKLRIAATKSQVAITDISDDVVSITPELTEEPIDQLELSLGLSHTSESQEVVIEESSEFYNQVKDNQVKE
jgi:cell division topological specificity factor